MFAIIAITVSTGKLIIKAVILGSTRRYIGSSPIICKASISSLTFIIPISEVNAEPLLPAIIIAVNKGANSLNEDYT